MKRIGGQPSPSRSSSYRPRTPRASILPPAAPVAVPGRLNKSRLNFLTRPSYTPSPTNLVPGTTKVNEFIKKFNSSPINTSTLQRGPKKKIRGEQSNTPYLTEKNGKRPSQTPEQKEKANAKRANRANRKEQVVNEVLRVFNENVVKNSTPDPKNIIPPPVQVSVNASIHNVLKTSEIVNKLEPQTATVETAKAETAASPVVAVPVESPVVAEAGKQDTATAISTAATAASTTEEKVPEFDPSVAAAAAAAVVGAKNTQGQYISVDGTQQNTANPRLPRDNGYMDVKANDTDLKADSTLPTNYLQVESSTQEQFNSPRFVNGNSQYLNILPTTNKAVARPGDASYMTVVSDEKIPEDAGYMDVAAANVTDTSLQVESGENPSRKPAEDAERKLYKNAEKNRILAANQQALAYSEAQASASQKRLDAINKDLVNANQRKLVLQQTPTGNDINNYFNRLEKDTTQSFSTDQKQQLLGARKEKETIDTEAKRKRKPPDYTGFWGRLRGAFATLGKYRDEELEIETIKRDQLAQQYNEQKLSHDALKANQEAMAQALADPTINSLRAAMEEAKAEKAAMKSAAAAGGFRKSRTKKSFFKKNRTKKSFSKKNRTKKSFSNKAGFKKSHTHKLFNKRTISNKQGSARG